MTLSKKLSAFGLTLLAGAAACDPQLPPQGGDGDVDQALLATYKRALPRASILEAPRPGSRVAGLNLAVGDQATYPQIAVPIVVGINTHIKAIIDGLEVVTSLPPTLYDSESQEMVWGPFDDGESEQEGDKVLVYIKDNGEGSDADFRYHYALARGVGEDISTYVPVILGGANPDAENEDHGAGVTLFDFAANATFMAEHYPDHGPLPTGRFAAAYSKDEQQDGKVLTVVLAAFRGFSEDGVGPRDLDHLWGHVEDPDGLEFDFVHIDTTADMHRPDGSDLDEDLSLRLAFVERGVGRGEAIASGGDLDNEPNGPIVGEGTECWDAAIAREYFELALYDGADARTVLETEGALESCGAFAQSLDDLGVPSLDSVPQEMRDAVVNAAENGLGE